MSSDIQPSQSDVLIELIDNEDDIARAYDITLACFGHQTRDGIWMATNPGWDTPTGRAAGIARNVARWRSATKDKNCDFNTMFLKATVPDPKSNGQRIMAGFAIWVQLSTVDGHGDKPVEDLSQALDLEALYPDSEAERRYCVQMDASLHAQRIAAVKDKSHDGAQSGRPAVMVLDLCAVNSAFQRRGIANKLVRWGLDEAERRGGLEALTEASSMGRGAYAKLGFRQEGGEIEYDVDDEFRTREKPSNVFMRTGPNLAAS